MSDKVNYSLIRPGDTVHIGAHVMEIDEETVRVRISTASGLREEIFNRYEILEHAPQPVKRGDKVRVGAIGGGAPMDPAHVIYTDLGFAWITWDDGRQGIWPVDRLEVMP